VVDSLTLDTACCLAMPSADVNYERGGYSAWTSYGQSKTGTQRPGVWGTVSVHFSRRWSRCVVNCPPLPKSYGRCAVWLCAAHAANILHAVGLSKRLHGLGITAVSLHPGESVAPPRVVLFLYS
jgi:hypothetical protein